ncbi:MAG TPA: isoprenylcysteine carboxylmethyltransferase family protein [Blastocatellia bacterium]|nr:isoprenylcysteine carboxylmethyltransferase family protein [Blastocatellia bacterium]
MNKALLVIYLLNLSLIGMLPALFFRRDGRLNLMWWTTASPFLVCAISLLAAYFGYLDPATGRDNRWAVVFEIASAPFAVASIALMFFTLGTHRIPLSLWHQENDAPRYIVTYGAYSRIRHPFYSSFLMALLGAFIFLPAPATLLAFICGFLILNFTAAREEERLRASEFGSEYATYMRRTGRFWPRVPSAPPDHYESTS